MTKILRNKKGVSLVELIAVIVIMGIIAAVAIPTTTSVIQTQKNKAALRSSESMVTAMKTILLSENIDDSRSIAAGTSAADLLAIGVEYNQSFVGTLTVTYTASTGVYVISTPVALVLNGVPIYTTGTEMTLTAP